MFFPKYFFLLYYYFPCNCVTQMPDHIITLRPKPKLPSYEYIYRYFYIYPSRIFSLRSLLPQETFLFNITVFLLRKIVQSRVFSPCTVFYSLLIIFFLMHDFARYYTMTSSLAAGTLAKPDLIMISSLEPDSSTNPKLLLIFSLKTGTSANSDLIVSISPLC